VKSHLKRAFVKLDVDRRAQAVLQAQRLGLLMVVTTPITSAQNPGIPATVITLSDRRNLHRITWLRESPVMTATLDVDS